MQDKMKTLQEMDLPGMIWTRIFQNLDDFSEGASRLLLHEALTTLLLQRKRRMKLRATLPHIP
jgi:hypothetical protein